MCRQDVLMRIIIYLITQFNYFFMKCAHLEKKKIIVPFIHKQMYLYVLYIFLLETEPVMYE